MKCVLNITAAVFLGLVLMPASYGQELSGDLLIEPGEFRSELAPKISGLDESQHYMNRFRSLERSIGVGGSFTAPLAQYLAPTDLGPLEVTPLHASMSLFSGLYGSSDWEAAFSLTSGTVQLTPATEPDAAPSVGVPARLDVTIALRVSVADSLFFAALQHVSDTPSEEGQFLVFDRPRSLSYTVDPLNDRIFLFADLPWLRSKLLVHRRFEHFSLGRSFSHGLPFLRSIVAQVAVDRLPAAGWQFGSQASLNIFGIRVEGSLFYLAGEDGPVAASAGAVWEGSVSAWQIAEMYLRPEIGAGYHPAAGGGYLRYGVSAGFDLFPDPEYSPVGMFMDLSVTRNSPDALHLMPLYGDLIISLKLGFSFL
jgi:hypothetical protein